jgi:hypothetical protein
MKEAAIQQHIRLALSDAGAVMFRNQVGATHTFDGRLIRYGICNPGGSDLIGWTPVQITEDMVGRTVAVFTAVEVKTPTGKATEDQLNFLAAVLRHGGFAGIARSTDEAVALIQR